MEDMYGCIYDESEGKNSITERNEIFINYDILWQIEIKNDNHLNTFVNYLSIFSKTSNHFIHRTNDFHE